MAGQMDQESSAVTVLQFSSTENVRPGNAVIRMCLGVVYDSK